MRLPTVLYSLLFDHHQPYLDAKQITGDMVLELLESKLDEGLSYLEDDNPRRAREEIQIVKEYGSMENFLKEARQKRPKTPDTPVS